MKYEIILCGKERIPECNIRSVVFHPSSALLALCISSRSHCSPLPHHRRPLKHCQQQKQVNMTHASLENHVTVPPQGSSRLLFKGACTWMLHCSVQSAVLPPTCIFPCASNGDISITSRSFITRSPHWNSPNTVQKNELC